MSLKKNTTTISIEGADGPTAVFVSENNTKLTVKQRIQTWQYQIKSAYVKKMLTAESHTIDEVMAYIVNTHGFVELAQNSEEVTEEYQQMRASFLLQYAPALLGEDAAVPPLKSTSKDDVQAHFNQMRERMQKASKIPVTAFDIDFHKFQKSFGGSHDQMHITIEKQHGYIGGGAVGNKKDLRQFHRIYKDVYKYFGVTPEDIKHNTERYQALVRVLSQ